MLPNGQRISAALLPRVPKLLTVGEPLPLMIGNSDQRRNPIDHWVKAR